MTVCTVASRTLAISLLLSWVAGCQDNPVKQKVASPAVLPAATYNVAILGDSTRIDLLTTIAAAHATPVNTDGSRTTADLGRETAKLRFLSSREDTVATQAALAWEADLVLLAVDARQGPLPIHREHVLVTRQMAVPALVVAFTNSGAIDDPELLELEELEMRELLNTYALPGDTAPCIFDHQAARTTAGSKAPKGPFQIVQSLEAIAKKRRPPESVREGTRFRASVYALVPQEAYTRDVAIAVKTGPATTLVGNESVAAEVIASREIAPGSNGEIDIIFARPMRVGAGQRFLLLNKQHVAATGFFLTDAHR